MQDISSLTIRVTDSDKDDTDPKKIRILIMKRSLLIIQMTVQKN
jgi:hypothetical protein